MIDVTKCIGCRKGIPAFIKENNCYSHLDLFATPEAGSIFRCENSDVVGDFLKENDNKGGIYVPKDTLKEVLDFQAYWWEDIISLAYDALKEQDKVTAFFNDGEKGNMMWNKPNADIEAALIAIAEKEGVKVDDESYPDLLKWK